MTERTVKLISKDTGSVRTKKTQDRDFEKTVKPETVNGFILQRQTACACGGDCPTCQAKHSNLPISHPTDASEIEADQIADKVMRMQIIEPVNSSSSKNTVSRKCSECEEEEKLHLKESSGGSSTSFAPPIVRDVLSSGGKPLEAETRAFMESRFNYDFGNVKIHDSDLAAKSASSINALAYTSGKNVVFNSGQYNPNSDSGKRLLAHELTHVVQQQESIDLKRIQRRQAPYIKKITVHLTPPQSADLEWEGVPPDSATGSDHFTVSTGKGYSDPGDPAGTCTRSCCSNADTQCAPPWNQPSRVGACCTYYGDNFWTGTPLTEHNGWQWWTPIQPYYSRRGIALHQHDTVTGQPIGHGCVRMDEPNAKRIFDFSNGRSTNVTTDGRAAPVECNDDRRCTSGTRGQLDMPSSAEDTEFAGNDDMKPNEPIEGLEGLMT